MYIILDPLIINTIATELKAEYYDYYLCFMCLYRCGYTASRVLKLTAKDVPDFIKQNRSFLGTELIDEIEAHASNKNPYEPLFCNKFSGVVLPRRTIEYWIKEYGRRHLDNSVIGFKHITRTFYYEQLRKADYDYESVKKIFLSRRMHMPDLEAFLLYCGMTEEEYLADKSRYQHAKRHDYIQNSKDIIQILCEVLSRQNVGPALTCELTEKTMEALKILRPLRGL